VGRGSIVNDKCVMRTELVGQTLGDGKNTFTPKTRCAPKRQALVCSLNFEGSPNCLKYDIATDALRKHADSIPLIAAPPKGQYANEYTNAAMQKMTDNFIYDFVETDPPAQLKKLSLDRYEKRWHNLCEMVHELWENYFRNKVLNRAVWWIKSNVRVTLYCTSGTPLSIAPNVSMGSNSSGVCCYAGKTMVSTSKR
jgi:hypothetical protein